MRIRIEIADWKRPQLRTEQQVANKLNTDAMVHLSGKLIRLRAFCCVARSVLLNVRVAPIISPTSRIVKRQAP